MVRNVENKKKEKLTRSEGRESETLFFISLHDNKQVSNANAFFTLLVLVVVVSISVVVASCKQSFQ